MCVEIDIKINRKDYLKNNFGKAKCLITIYTDPYKMRPTLKMQKRNMKELKTHSGCGLGCTPDEIKHECSKACGIPLPEHRKLCDSVVHQNHTVTIALSSVVNKRYILTPNIVQGLLQREETWDLRWD